MCAIENLRNRAVLRDKSNQVLNTIQNKCIKISNSQNLNCRSHILTNAKKITNTRTLKSKSASENAEKIKTRSRVKEISCTIHGKDENPMKENVEEVLSLSSAKVSCNVRGKKSIPNPTTKKVYDARKRVIKDVPGTKGKIAYESDAVKENAVSKSTQLTKSVSSNYCPIWRKQTFNTSKRKKDLKDIYDISKDEEFMYCEEVNLKKKKSNSSKPLKKKPETRGGKMQNKKSVKSSVVKGLQVTDKTVKIGKNETNKNVCLVATKNDENNTTANCNVLETIEISVNNLNDENCNINDKDNDEIASLISQDSQKVPQRQLVERELNNDCILLFPENRAHAASTETECCQKNLSQSSESDKKVYLNNLFEEFERSLLVPKMTSTPDNSLLGAPSVQSNCFKKIAEISSILPSNAAEEKTLASPKASPIKVAKVDGDVFLFESPCKKKEQKKIAKPKTICKSIESAFSTFLEASPAKVNLEESVLKPNKAYHTPDNFKIHIARTKRTYPVQKQKVKSKVDEFAEKMTHHFDEIENMELCIE